MAALDVEFIFPTKGSETCEFSYDTLNQITGTGIERTIPRRLEYKLAIDFDTFTTRCHTDFTTIRDFYLGQAKGSENSFWYRCPVEYKINSFDAEEYQDTTDTYKVAKYGILAYTGVGNDYQAMIVYHVGLNGSAASQRVGFKTVLRLDGSTIAIKNITSNSAITGFSIGTSSNTRGIVTLPAGSNTAHNYRWTGEYLHRMRFDSDLNATPVRGQSLLYEISGLRMIEKPTTAHRAFGDTNWFQSINKDFNPPSQPNYNLTYAFYNKSDSLSVDRELITRDETEVTASLTTDQTIIHHTTKQYYMTWFNAMRGSLLTFNLLAQQARMDDRLSISTEAWQTCEKFRLNPFNITLKGDALEVIQSPTDSCFYTGTSTQATNNIDPQSPSDPSISSQTFYINQNPTTPTNPSGTGAYFVTTTINTPAVFNNLGIFTNNLSTDPLTNTIAPRIHAMIIGNDGKRYLVYRNKVLTGSPLSTSSRIGVIEVDFETCLVTNRYISPTINNFNNSTSAQPNEQMLSRVIRNGKFANYEYWTTSAPTTSLGTQEVHCYYVDSTGTVQRQIFAGSALTANSSGKYRSAIATSSMFPMPFHFDGNNTYYCYDIADRGYQEAYTASIAGTDFVITPRQSNYTWAQTAQAPTSVPTGIAAPIPSLRFPMTDASPSNNSYPVIGNSYPVGIKFAATPTFTGLGSWKTMSFDVMINNTVLASGKTTVRYSPGSGSPVQFTLDSRAITSTALSNRARGIQAFILPQSGKLFMSYVIDGIDPATANDAIPSATPYRGHHYGWALMTSRSDSTILESFTQAGLGATSASSDFSTNVTVAPGTNDITKRVLGGTITHINDNPSGDLIGEFHNEGSSDTSRRVFFKRRGTNHFVLLSSVPTYTTTDIHQSTNFIWIPQYASWLQFRYTSSSTMTMIFVTPS